MELDYLRKFDNIKGQPRYNAAVRDEILRQVGGVGGRKLTEEEKALLLQHATIVKNRAEKENYPIEDQTEAGDRFQIALDLTSGDPEKERAARLRITADKQSQGYLPSLEEQAAIVQAIEDNSPLKPLDDLVKWIRDQWEKWILPTIQAIKEMYDIFLPWIKKILEALPQSLDIIRKDLLIPYLEACENWKEHLSKVSHDLRDGPNAAALDINGIPAISGPNFDMGQASKLKAALSISFVRDLAEGVIAPLIMEQYQANTKRGFYSDVQYYKWLLGSSVGPDLVGIANDLMRTGRRVSNPVGGLAGVLADQAEDTLGQIPDWFIANTTPKIDPAGRIDYYLR